PYRDVTESLRRREQRAAAEFHEVVNQLAERVDQPLRFRLCPAVGNSARAKRIAELQHAVFVLHRNEPEAENQRREALLASNVAARIEFLDDSSPQLILIEKGMVVVVFCLRINGAEVQGTAS